MKQCLIFLIVLAVVFAVSPFYSNAEERKKSYAMSARVYKQLEESNLLIEEEKYAEALTILTEIFERRLSDYEKAQVHSLIGGVYFRQTKYTESIESFAKVLESRGNMPETLLKQTLRTLTQLNMVEENYEQAKLYGEQLVVVGEVPDQNDYVLLTQANYKLEAWKDALDSSQKGIAIAQSQDKIPAENLYIALNAVYYETEQLAKMEPVLKSLIKYYPKTSYILYLASVYGQLDRIDKQLVLMESLYEDGRVTERNQIRNLASLYISERSPYKGAVLLEEALNSGAIEPNARDFELLAQAWRLAAEREKTILALTKAGELSDNGKPYLQKAYMHFDMGEWSQAKQSVMQSLDKGLEDKQTGEAWLLLGMTRFKLKQFDDAILACEKAKNYKNSAKHAKQWITYISSEKQVYESMTGPVS